MLQNTRNSFRIHIIIAISIQTFFAGSASAIPITWFGGTGDWGTATNWVGGVLPAAGDDVIIDSNNGIGSVVTQNVSASIGSLTIDSGDTLTTSNGISLSLTGGAGMTNTNNGTLNLNSVNLNTSLNFAGGTDQTLTGNGEVVMSDKTTNRIITDNTVLTVDTNQTIRGAGQLLANSGGMINKGAILAQGGNALVIDPNGKGFVQQGTLEAQGSGGLRLINGDFDFTTAGVLVKNGSALTISTATVHDGTITTQNTNGATIIQSTLDNMTIDGKVRQNNGVSNTIKNGLTVNGSWNLNSVNLNTNLNFANGDGTDQTLTGNGEVVMSDKTTNRIITDNTVLTVDTNQTIRGAGQLLANSGGMINKGAILAQGGNALVIDPNGKGFVQQGTLEAQGSGGLRLINGDFDFTTAGVLVKNGSALTISTATVHDGTITTQNTNGATIIQSTLDNMTIDGKVRQNNGVSNTIKNGLTVNGSWNLNSVNLNTNLNFANGDGTDQTLTGNGEVVMSDKTTNRIITDNTVLTVDTNQTIRGAGQLLANSGGMINKGAILAQGGNALVIDPNGKGFVQQGTLEAQGSGGLRLINGDFDFTTAGVLVKNGSALTISTATVHDGTITTQNTNGATIIQSTLDNMTIDGKVRQNNGVSNTIKNGLTVNGSWNLNSVNLNTNLNFANGDGTDQTLTGNGEVVMSDKTTNRIITDNTVLTVDTNQTIRGAGQLLANSGGMINKGTIRSEGANSLTIDANALGFENRGTVDVSNAGGLRNVGDYLQTAGTTHVDSTLTLQSGVANIQGGLVSGTGTIVGDVNNTGGTVGPGNSPGTLNINGDYMQAAAATLAIEIAGLFSFDLLDITGDATIDGTISVSLLGGYAPTIGDTFRILVTNSLNGTFNTNLLPTSSGIPIFDVVYGADFIELTTVANSAVPLPAAVWFLLSGLAGLGVFSRKKKTA